MRALVQDRNIDVLTLCETWQEDLETARPIDSKKSDSVNCVNHGGVAVIARHGFSIAKIDLKIKVVTSSTMPFALLLRVHLPSSSFIVQVL